MSEISYDLQAMTEMAVRNPAGLQRVAVDYVQAKLGGNTIPDPLAPLIQLLEVGSTQTAMGMQESLAIDRRRYALLSTTPEDLYCVMSDTDYLERFSGPAVMPLQMLLRYDDVLSAMVTDPTSGIKRLVIPRYTTLSAKTDYQFTLLYPIEIRMLTSGELQVVYNTEATSPLQPLTNNTIDFVVRRYPDRLQYLILSLDINQLARSTQSFSINDGASLSTIIPFDDLYYYARVWSVNADGTQVEMATTHAEVQHDTRVLTAYLQVDTVGDTLKVTIPPIYQSNGLLGQQVRVDVYTCKGNLNVPMSGVLPDQYTWEYGVDSDTPALQGYSGGLSLIPMQVWSDGFIWGGHAQLDFETQRDRVIYRRSTVDTPIMPTQVGAQASINGYTVTLGRDDVSGRIFYASRQAPNNPSSVFTTPIPAGVATVQTTLAQLAALPGTFDNGPRVTMTPKTLFNVSNGVAGILDSSQYPNVLAANQDDLVTLLNDGNYAYTPYHYVVDTTNDNLALRAYYLDNQQMMSREFLEENMSTQLSIQSQGIALERTDKGWRLTVTCTPSANYTNIDPSNVNCQLAFIPVGETGLAYQNGTLLKVEKDVYYWQWLLEGNLDFDASNNTYLDNWSIYDTQLRTLAARLTQDFYLVHSVSNYSVTGMVAAEFDNKIGKFLLTGNPVGVQLERLTLRLGTAMTDLWQGARTVTGAQSFATYDEDVMAYYPDDVYEVFNDTGLDFKVVDGEVVRNLLHAKGDPILGDDGKQLIRYPKGSVKYVNGLPIVTTNRTTTCVLDIYLLAGIYYFATAAKDLADAAYLPARMADLYLPDVAAIIPNGFENTHIFFYPQSNLSSINLITDDNQSLMLESGLSVKGTVWLTDTAYNSDAYRASVQQIISNVLTQMLQSETVSMKDVITSINNTVDTGVKGFELHLYAGDKELNTFSAGDDTIRTTLRRLIKVNDDGKLGVVQDITLLWDRHVPRSEALYATTTNGVTYTGS